MLAAAALLTDYILTAAVGISAGVGALVSAIPSLLPHTVCHMRGDFVFITILNLRGVREAGVVFMVPTYLFVGTLLIMIVAGVFRVVASGGHPVPVAPLPPPPPDPAAVRFWLLLKVFASGCTALTGVEAVSNGVKAFREPAVKNAQSTLTVIIFVLAILLAGISYLVKAYGIAATDPGQPGYQSILSMLLTAIFGKGIFYYVTIAGIFSVLSLSANTAFADFPRLCRAIAQDNYLPHVFGYRGRRLVYSYGIVVLGGADLCAFSTFSRRNRQTDSALRSRRVPGLYPFAIRHGGALVQKSRPSIGERAPSSMALERFRNRHHRDHRARREIYRRRMDHRNFYSILDFLFSPGPPPLSNSCVATESNEVAEPAQRGALPSLSCL